jgi:FtsP/CotA-like multicopper oxidase with cupredoxin domain
MSVHLSRLQIQETTRPAARRLREAAEGRCRSSARRWLCAGLCVAAAVALQALPARAQQFVPCAPTQQSLQRVPELVTQNGVLRGTIVLSDEQEAMPFRQPPQSKPGDPGSLIRCAPQYVRMLRGLGASPAPPPTPADAYPNTMPGPTLRARVGDIIQLTFINEINPGHFGRSIDNGETGVGCDQPVPPGDVFPDCFHGSSTGNIHFHGTHTNPNGTGDNVFVEVRPLPRDNQGRLTTTPEQVQKSLDTFFAQCETVLKANALTQWPKTWADLPADWTNQQKSLLQAYDKQLASLYGVPPAKQLWPVDAGQLQSNQWPQYYIGAFPYCYRLPEYTAQTWPPQGRPHAHMTMTSGTGARAAVSEVRTGGAGTSELNSVGVTPPEQMGESPALIMGQSPGTHWYHAHKHGSTAINVANGMTGVFIIEGQYDDDLNAFYGDGWTRTQPVLVMNQLGVTPNLLRGGQNPGGQGATDKGPNFSVNGQTQPVIDMRPGEVQMWRIVNTSGRAGAFFLAPHQAGGKYDQYEWRQIAQDGVQFNDFNYQRHRNNSFLLASGNRADLLVKAMPCPNSVPSCTYPVLVQNEVDPSDRASANKLTVLSIKVSGQPVDPDSPRAKFIPAAPQHFPPFLADIGSGEVTGTKTITFASTPPSPAEHTINGVKFDGNVGALVQLNRVEEWKIVNQTFGPAISHPFHIHINPFQVVEVFNPNEPLIDPKTGKTPIDPRTGKPWIDPQTNKVAVKYAFHGDKLAPGQCYLDPNDPDSWSPRKWQPGGCVAVPTPPNKNNIWWDVFPIPSGYAPTTDAAGKVPLQNGSGQPVQVPGYFKMRSRFVDFSGYYVLHCHILAHEDRGMMTVVEVSPAPLPYSHN